MDKLSGFQLVITLILSSGLVSGVVTMITKKVWSPESRNELARIGNEFAKQLLEDARSEREELRATIEELEQLIIKNDESIRKLKQIAEDKDIIIEICEERQLLVARKIQMNQHVTLKDLFGPDVPTQFLSSFNKPKKEE